VGIRTQVDKRHGSRDGRRAAARNNSRAQALPIEAAELYSFVSVTSTSTPSSLDSTASLVTDSCSLVSDSSTLSSPSLPTSSVDIRTSIHETAHDDDSHLFPMITDSSPRCPAPAEGLISGGESFIDHNRLGDVPKKSRSDADSGLNTRGLHHVQSEGDKPVAIVVTAADALSDPDELLLAALGKLEVADGPSIPEESKRTIVEALIIRELDQEEGFLDFSSF